MPALPASVVPDDWCAVLLDLVVRQVWLSAVVFIVVLALSRLLRGRWPALHCCMWGLVLLRLVLPPGLWHPLGAGHLFAHLPLLDHVAVSPGLENPPAQSRLLSPGISTPGGQPAAWPPIHSDLLVGLWLSVTAALLLRSSRQLRAYRRFIRQAQPVRDERLLAIMAAWRHRLGIRRPVRLLSSSAPAPPFTLGSLRPEVFLPNALCLGGTAAAEAVIAHELAHVKRWDSLGLWLQRLLQAVYFFHPLVWIAAARIDQLREQACDAVVLSFGTLSPRRYASTILHVLQLEPAAALTPAFVPNRPSRVSARIRCIIDGRRISRPHSAVVGLSALVLGAFLLPLAAGPTNPKEVPPVSSGTQESTSAAAPQPAVETADEMLQLGNPLPGSRVSWGYRCGRDPFTGKLRQHSGIDLAVGLGTPVLAAAGGTVELATTSWQQGEAWGHVVIVDHGAGIKTVYAHLGELHVNTGQTVAAGDVLASIGVTGKSTGPHLHFEVWKNGRHHDPTPYVDEW